MLQSLEFKIDEFQVFKRVQPEFKSRLVEKFPAVPNAYGQFPVNYSYEDSIMPNKTHFYKLIAYSEEGESYLIEEYAFLFQTDTLADEFKSKIEIPIGTVKKNTSYTVLIYDYFTEKILLSRQFDHERNDPDRYPYFTRDIIQMGYRKVIVEVINNDTKKHEKYTFDLRKTN